MPITSTPHAANATPCQIAPDRLVIREDHVLEAMLRQLLSTRDGHALGVTLLSSDMGKLYAALSQAIERRR